MQLPASATSLEHKLTWVDPVRQHAVCAERHQGDGSRFASEADQIQRPRISGVWESSSRVVKLRLWAYGGHHRCCVGGPRISANQLRKNGACRKREYLYEQSDSYIKAMLATQRHSLSLLEKRDDVIKHYLVCGWDTKDLRYAIPH